MKFKKRPVLILSALLFPIQSYSVLNSDRGVDQELPRGSPYSPQMARAAQGSERVRILSFSAGGPREFMKTGFYLAISLVQIFISSLASANTEKLIAAIIRNDIAFLKEQFASNDPYHPLVRDINRAYGATNGWELSKFPYLSPLMAAIQYDRPEAFQLLLENGADVNLGITYTDYLFTPISRAMNLEKDRKTFYIEQLLQRGAKANESDQNGRTYLHRSFHEEDASIFKLLVNAGANVNAVHLGCDTPLRRLILTRNEELVRFALSKGAKVAPPIPASQSRCTTQEQLSRNILAEAKELARKPSYNEIPKRFPLLEPEDFTEISKLIEAQRGEVSTRNYEIGYTTDKYNRPEIWINLKYESRRFATRFQSPTDQRAAQRILAMVSDPLVAYAACLAENLELPHSLFDFLYEGGRDPLSLKFIAIETAFKNDQSYKLYGGAHSDYYKDSSSTTTSSSKSAK